MVVVPEEVERAGLCLLIRDTGYDVIADASEGATAFKLAEQLEPDIAIIDFKVGDVPALSLVHSIMRKCPGTQVLLYTERCGRDWIELALREGARAFVLKGQVGKHLEPALRALADHRPYWDGAIDDEILDEFLETGPRPGLTSREWQVLQLVGEERTTKEIARLLDVSPRTIEHFRIRLRRKLGIRNKADLYRYVEQHHPGSGRAA
jgi:DNA-binding NarL/FixJ family response regulator